MWLESTFWTGRMLWQGLSILGPPKPNESNCSDIYSHMRVKFYNIWFWQILTYIHRSAFQGPTSNFLVHSPLWFERPQFAWAQTVGCLLKSDDIASNCEYMWIILQLRWIGGRFLDSLLALFGGSAGSQKQFGLLFWREVRTTSREIGSHQVEDVCDEIAEYGLKCRQLPMTGADILLFFRQALQDGVDAVQLGCNYSAAAIMFKITRIFCKYTHDMQCDHLSKKLAILLIWWFGCDLDLLGLIGTMALMRIM